MESSILRRAELMGGSRERVLEATPKGHEVEYSIVDRSLINRIDSTVIYSLFDKEKVDIEFTRFIIGNPEWIEKPLIHKEKITHRG